MNKIIHGDCIEIMKGLSTGDADLVVTSPPYNLRNSTGNGMKPGSTSKLWRNPKLSSGYDGNEDNLPHEEYVEWQRDCISQMMRIIPEEGAIFYNHKWRVQNGLIQDRSDILQGFPVRQIIIWYRRGGLNFNLGYFLPTYEVIYLITKSKFKLKRSAVKYGDMWSIPPEKNSDHPAPFPFDLAARCIESTDAKIVLDPFNGSGTTCLAARSLGRGYIGIDCSKDYCQMAEERMKDDLPILDGLDSREDVKLQPDNLGEMVGG